MKALAISIIVLIGSITMAVTETIVTPTPGLGHGKLADGIALVLWFVTLPAIQMHRIF